MRAPLIFLALVFAFTARAADRVFESGPTRTHLIELFTSQGCSSCPRAEAWLSKLKNQPGLWENFVPIAFHVDYWDRLGWRDPFASKEWTARQYQYSATWKNESVYTPGFVLDGREWVGRSIPSPSTARLAFLKLSVTNRTVIGEFVPADNGAGDVDLHVVTLGFDLNTRITAGENSGRNLKQDFVVLSLTNQKMSAGKIEFAFAPDARAGAIAAWITASNQIEPIQAVGGWLR
jgi:hypothetical protein